MKAIFDRLVEAARTDPKRQKYYLTHDKHGNELNGGNVINAAYFRDNTLDILEEQRDAIVILELLEDRIMRLDPTNVNEILDAIARVHTAINDAVWEVLVLRELLPPELNRDMNEVVETKRLVSL